MKDSRQAEIGVVSTAVHLDLARAMHEMTLANKDWKAKDMAEFLGVSLVSFQNMFWCRSIPETFSDFTAARLQKLTGKTVEELFPKILRRKNYAQMVVHRTQMLQRAQALRFHSAAPPDNAPLDDQMAYGQLWGAVYSALTSSLPILDQMVMKLLWLPENQHTYSEVAPMVGLTENQIRMIERRSLPKMLEDDLVLACLATM